MPTRTPSTPRAKTSSAAAKAKGTRRASARTNGAHPTPSMDLEGRVTVTYETLTPTRASHLLSRMGHNRTYRARLATDYAQLMTDHVWQTPHPDPLILSPDGEVLNAQHRLNAIVLSGLAQPMVVWQLHEAMPELMYRIDQGFKRTPNDVLSIALGEKLPVESAGMLRHFLAGTSSRLGGRFAGMNDAAFIEAFDRHRAAIEWVLPLFATPLAKRTKGIARIPTKAAFARAWYHAPASELEGLIGLFITAEGAKATHRPLMALRDYCLGLTGGGREVSQAVFGMTTYAIEQTLARKQSRRLVVPETDLYPIPDR